MINLISIIKLNCAKISLSPLNLSVCPGVKLKECANINPWNSHGVCWRGSPHLYSCSHAGPGLQSTNGINNRLIRIRTGSGYPLTLTATMWMWNLIGMGIGLIDGNNIGNIEKKFCCNLQCTSNPKNQNLKNVTDTSRLIYVHFAKTSGSVLLPVFPMSVSSLVNSWPALK